MTSVGAGRGYLRPPALLAARNGHVKRQLFEAVTSVSRRLI